MRRAARALLAAFALAVCTLAPAVAGRALEVATYNLRLDTPADA